MLSQMDTHAHTHTPIICYGLLIFKQAIEKTIFKVLLQVAWFWLTHEGGWKVSLSLGVGSFINDNDDNTSVG